MLLFVNKSRRGFSPGQAYLMLTGSKKGREDKEDDKRKKKRSPPPPAAAKSEKKKKSPKKKKNNMSNRSSGGNSSDEDLSSPIPPPPGRRVFRLVEPPNPSRHGSMAASASSSSSSRGFMDHIPNSIDELFGAQSESTRPSESARPQQQQAPSNLASIPQRRISINPPNVESPPAERSAPPRAVPTRPGDYVDLLMGPGGRMFILGPSNRRNRPTASASSSGEEEQGANIDERATPILVDGVWVQNRVKSCKRMYYPTMVQMVGSRENGVVREYYSNPVVLNTLIVEGPISAKIEEASGHGIHILVERNLPMDDDSSVKIYVTQFQGPVRIQETDEGCEHSYQPYIHCDKCGPIDRLGGASNPHVPEFFTNYRKGRLLSKYYRILHISTTPPARVQCTPSDMVPVDKFTTIELGERMRIPILYGEGYPKICFVDAIDGASIGIFEPVSEKIMARDRTLIVTARNRSAVALGGFFQEMMICCVNDSTVNAVGTTCQSLLAIVNQGSKVDRCVAVELLDAYVDGNGEIAPSAVRPEKFVLNNYDSASNSWRQVNPRRGGSPLGVPPSRRFHPAGVPLAQMFSTFIRGVDGEDSDEDGLSSPSDAIPDLEDDPLLHIPHQRGGPPPGRPSQPHIHIINPMDGLLRMVMARSMNDPVRPKNPINPETFRCAPRPKDPEKELKKGTNKEDTCAICLDFKSNHIMIPCGHLCVCTVCANDLKDKGCEAKCPICMKEISNVQVVY